MQGMTKKQITPNKSGSGDFNNDPINYRIPIVNGTQQNYYMPYDPVSNLLSFNTFYSQNTQPQLTLSKTR